ncbi:Fcf1-domain-containing protein [Xylariales sp. PMI_506]|nr:Fcf1-domain-containing protein [Xylariales sp. PMI_506]
MLKAAYHRNSLSQHLRLHGPTNVTPRPPPPAATRSHPFSSVPLGNATGSPPAILKVSRDLAEGMKRSPLPLLASSIPPVASVPRRRPRARPHVPFSHSTRRGWQLVDPHLSSSFSSPSASGTITTPLADSCPRLPFRFETGFALFAKRTPRPFPPPFLSPPSGSFSDPLSTHHQSRDKRAFVDGEVIRGWTNGDDAVYASDHFICANDGVGAWSMRPRGHAGLWSRLILHFWVAAMQEDIARPRPPSQQYNPDPISYLQAAYERTLDATAGPDCQGTTTATGAQLFYRGGMSPHSSIPLLYVTNVGDSQVMVVRPSDQEMPMVYKSTEQWHWFDCPRQLGTNSPDTPTQNAVLDVVELEEGDVVLAMSDGVTDNLWEHEIVENVRTSVRRWERGEGGPANGNRYGGANGGMTFVAQELMSAAKTVALDPFAESPFMEHAIEEGLASEGGKLDDISVVAGLCIRNTGGLKDHDLNAFQSQPTLGRSAARMPRAHRAKQYRKLMQKFSMSFGFREPYQVLVDAQLLADANRFKMDLVKGLEQTLSGKVKVLVTQCSMRHLYGTKGEPGVEAAIEQGKTFERRRCGHHPDQYPKPLSTLECLLSVVDPKDAGINKHRYVVACNDSETRTALRLVKGVPLIYISRSVMIMENMAEDTAAQRSADERAKLRAEIKRFAGAKRKRDDEEQQEHRGDDKDNGHEDTDTAGTMRDMSSAAKPEKKAKKQYGKKAPNPLSTKKSAKAKPTDEHKKPNTEVLPADADSNEPAKKKRKRKYTKSKHEGDATGDTPAGDGTEAHESTVQPEIS